MAQPRRYLLLDDPSPSEEIPKILGLIVLEPGNPLDLRTPKNSESPETVQNLANQYRLKPVEQANVRFVLDLVAQVFSRKFVLRGGFKEWANSP